MDNVGFINFYPNDPRKMKATKKNRRINRINLRLDKDWIIFYRTIPVHNKRIYE